MKQGVIDLSVVVAVSTDVNIRKCLDSIDMFCEVVVVLNDPSEEVSRIVNSYTNNSCFKIKIITLNEKNLGMARDLGIINANNNKIVITDSDCTFQPDVLRIYDEYLDEYQVVKGRIRFLSNSIGNKLVANARDYFNDASRSKFVSAISLAFRKEIITRIGGYYFDHSIKWIEDAELNIRLAKSGLSVFYIDAVCINHISTSIFYDLRSSFRYGTGKRIGVEKKIMKGIFGINWKILPGMIKEKGVGTGLYMVIFNIAYFIGYLSKSISLLYKKNK